MKRIVIIEDHPVLASIYRNKFTVEGFQVESASDGVKGLELINRIKPDLVVLDLAMPKMNGIEVLKRLRTNNLFKDLPVIIFSDSAWKQQAWREGATSVLSKSGHSPSQVVEAARDALLKFESRPAQGTQTTNIPVPAAPSTVSANQTRRNEGHVLLIEDQDDLCATISAALEESGFRVTSVGSHADALRQLAAVEFDAHLVNRVCPDGIGLAMCRQLRNLYPQKPIVMYSTAAIPITAEQHLHADANIYLTDAADIFNPGPILLDLIKAERSSKHTARPTAVEPPAIPLRPNLP